MTDEEIGQLLEGLEELLRELGLGFIVEQERVLAAEGVSKSGADLSIPDVVEHQRYWQPEASLSGQRRSARAPKFNAKDVQVVPLDVRARLGLLLDLVEVTTAGTLAMERAVYAEIASVRDVDESGWAGSWDGTVTFASPPEVEFRGEPQENWTLAVDATYDSSLAHAARVATLVESLRALAGVSRGERLVRVDGADSRWEPAGGAS